MMTSYPAGTRYMEAVRAELRRSADELRRVYDILICSDPDDEAIRRAHGFDVDASDFAEVCRNGCGRTYDDIAGGKVRTCSASDHAATRAVREAEAAVWAFGRQSRL